MISRLLATKPTLAILPLFLLATLTFLVYSHLQSLKQNLTSPPPAQAQGSSCPVGNNTAKHFREGGNFAEAPTLAIWNGTDANGAVAQAIRESPGPVIVRLAVGTLNNDTADPTVYAQALNDIYSEVNTPFIAQVSHNETNCAGYNDMQARSLGSSSKQAGYASTVVSNINSAITPITGQIDFYCGDPEREPPSAYISALMGIPGMKGLALPFYTGNGGLSWGEAVALFQDAAGSHPVYVTESGHIPNDDPQQEPTAENFREMYLPGLDAILPGVQLLMLFDASDNPNPDFPHTTPFWDKDCREALRNECSDHEAVIEACFGEVEIVCDIAHSCNCYCQGNASSPCNKTPDNDCSIPDDPKAFTDYLPVDTEEQLTRIAKMRAYLEYYLPFTQNSFGFKYQLRGEVDNAQTCQTDYQFPAEGFESDEDNCRGAYNQGQALVDAVADTLSLNSYQADDANTPATNRLEYTSHWEVPNAPIKELMGENIKTSNTAWWFNQLGAIYKLKDHCRETAEPGRSWGADRFWAEPVSMRGSLAGAGVGYHLPWDKAYCMNFQVLECDDCQQFDNKEDILFDTFLSPCKNGYSLACFNAFNNMPESIQEAVIEQLPVWPKQRSLFLVATEQARPEDEAGGSIYELLNLLVSEFKEIVLRYQNPATGNEGNLTTYFSSFAEVTGQDTLISTQFARNTFSPDSDYREEDARGPWSFAVDNNPNYPFHVSHLPQEYLETIGNLDLRFFIIQHFFRQAGPACDNLSVTHVDRTTNEHAHSGLKVPANYSTTSRTANLQKQVQDEGDSYDLNRYLGCVLGPRHFEVVDDLNYDLARILTPIHMQAELLPYGELVYNTIEADISTVNDPVTHDSICRESHFECVPDGVDENGDPVESCSWVCDATYPDTQQNHRPARLTPSVSDPAGIVDEQDTIDTLDVTQYFRGIRGMNWLELWWGNRVIRPLPMSNPTHFTMADRCDESLLTWYECLTEGGTIPDPGEEISNACIYTNQTTTIPDEATARQMFCDAAAPDPSTGFPGVPGYVLRAIYDIEGTNNFGTSESCIIDTDHGGVGPFQITVNNCNQNTADDGLCDFETSLNLAAAILANKTNFVPGLAGKPPSSWTAQDVYQAAGYYNGSGSTHCTQDTSTGSPNVSGGQSYCLYAATAYDESWRCPGDPVVSIPSDWL